MANYSQSLSASTQQRVIRFTLSVPMQATLFISLCALIIWTVYFSTYPPAHNTLHQLRHSTAAVACH